jgi:predicted nucleotidyltransferase
VTRDEFLAALSTSLRDLTGWLNTAGIRHVIVGGVAQALVGRPRITEDIDAVVLAEQRNLSELLEGALKFGFIPRRENAVEFALANRILLLVHEADGIPVDVSLGILPFEQEMIERATRVTVQGTEIPIATPEDLIVMKVLAFRGKDVVDIEAVLDANKSIDLERIRYWVAGMAEALDEPGIAARFEALLKARQRAS